jgi:hypothetical protein
MMSTALSTVLQCAFHGTIVTSIAADSDRQHCVVHTRRQPFRAASRDQCEERRKNHEVLSQFPRERPRLAQPAKAGVPEEHRYGESGARPMIALLTTIRVVDTIFRSSLR